MSPKVASHYLLEKIRTAGVRELYVIIRPGKWDILEYYQDGARFGLDIAYLVADEPLGPPFTLDHAYPFASDATVLFGFPDILFQPSDAFATALARLYETGADVVLGAFPPHPDEAFDFLDAAADGRVKRLVPKESLVDRAARYQTWVFAVWQPTFTEFLHEEISRLRALAKSGVAGLQPEWPVGSTIDAAIEAGLHVNSVYFPAALYTDIGKPDRLVRALEFPGVWNGIGAVPTAD